MATIASSRPGRRTGGRDAPTNLGRGTPTANMFGFRELNPDEASKVLDFTVTSNPSDVGHGAGVRFGLPGNSKILHGLLVMFNLAVAILSLVFGITENTYAPTMTVLRPVVDTGAHLPAVPELHPLGTLPVLVAASAAAFFNAVVHFAYSAWPQYVNIHERAKCNDFRFMHLGLAGAPLILCVMPLVGIAETWTVVYTIVLWISSCALDLFLEVYLSTREVPNGARLTSFEDADTQKPLSETMRVIYHRLSPSEWAIYGVTRLPIVTIVTSVIVNSAACLVQDSILWWWPTTAAFGFVAFVLITQTSTLLRILHVGYWTSYAFENTFASILNTFMCVFFCLCVFIGTAAVA